jgi:hypothetical protein
VDGADVRTALTARKRPRPEGGEWIACGHPSCRGVLGWTWTPGPRELVRRPGYNLTLDERVVVLRERVLAAGFAGVGRYRSTWPRPATDQDGVAGEQDAVLEVNVDDFPVTATCPRRGCHRRSVIPTEFAKDTRDARILRRLQDISGGLREVLEDQRRDVET